jgi:hypothetical protein
VRWCGAGGGGASAVRWCGAGGGGASAVPEGAERVRLVVRGVVQCRRGRSECGEVVRCRRGRSECG